LLRHPAMDDLDDLDEECACAGSGVENLDEALARIDAVRDLETLVALRHLFPGSRVGEAIFEPELLAEELIHRAYDERDHRARSVEDTAPGGLFHRTLYG